MKVFLRRCHTAPAPSINGKVSPFTLNFEPNSDKNYSKITADKLDELALPETALRCSKTIQKNPTKRSKPALNTMFDCLCLWCGSVDGEWRWICIGICIFILDWLYHATWRHRPPLRSRTGEVREQRSLKSIDLNVIMNLLVYNRKDMQSPTTFLVFMMRFNFLEISFICYFFDMSATSLSACSTRFCV